jgi:transposase
LLPKPSRRGRKPSVDLREVLNAIRYMARSAGGWRMLPVHFEPLRFCRRLQLLRGWSLDEQDDEQVLA